MVCLCLCVWRGLSPKASQAPSGSPGISSSLQALGFPGLSPAGCWGSPWIPQHRSSNPRALPAAPSPRSDPRRAACPFKSGPADITAGGGAGPAPGSAAAAGPGSALRPPAALGTPARDAPSRLLQPPRPQAPPQAWPEPQSLSGEPQDCPCSLSFSGSLSPSVSLSVSFPSSRCLGLSISQPRACERLPVSLSLSDLFTSRAPEALSPRTAGS